MSTLKFSDLIKQYDGQGDISEWLEKLELVCKLQKVKDLQSVIPLSLSCLMDNTKLNYTVLTQAFQNAFLCQEPM